MALHDTAIVGYAETKIVERGARDVWELGAEILELIQEPTDSIQRAGGPEHPARFWGLAVCVADLDRTVELLGSNVSEIRPAVQAGRRIATLRRSAGVTVPLALMSSAPAKV